MTSKRYALAALFFIGILTLGFVLFNVWMDEFDLYGDATGEKRRIWTYNRASKYLLAANHIPANFEGILIGSSSSACMMDTRQLDGYRIYNLSMNGANACEVAKAALKALDSGKMRYLIICLDPYLTQDSQMKTGELQPDLKQNTLGSLFMVRFYLYKLWYTLHPEQDPYRESWWGYREALSSERLDTPKIFAQKDTPADPVKPIIDSKAVKCLKQVIDEAHQRHVAIVAYFHPRSEPNLRGMDYGDYRKAMLNLFESRDCIIDMTGPEYASLRQDPEAYNDHVHLSAKGASLVLERLHKELDSLAPNPNGLGQPPQADRKPA